jgi:hypothetical protein
MGGPVQAGEVAIEDLEALRVPLAGYCYRLLGSAVDTDDAVQETLIRASSRRDQYDPGRGRLSARRPDPVAIGDPEDAGHRDLLRRYVTAFEAHDIEGLKAVLRGDAVASMPPFAWRLAGAEAIATAVGASDFCAGARLAPCRMNGACGFGQYRPGRRRRSPPVRPGGSRDLGRADLPAANVPRHPASVPRVRSASGEIWHRWQTTPNGHWSAWSQLDGALRP